MGQIIEVIQTQFDGGMSKDKRAGWSFGKVFSTNKFALSKCFDVFSYPKKIIPQYKTGAFEAVHSQDDKSAKIVKFLYIDDILYGFGVALNTTQPRVWVKGTTHWDNAGGTDFSAYDTRNTSVFFHYLGKIYMYTAGNRLVAYNIAATTFNDAVDTSSYTSVVQPVIHPSDGAAYFFHNDASGAYVSRQDGTGVFEPKILTLPKGYEIKSAYPYNNFLALGLTTTGSVKQSIVFLWDMDSTLADLTDRIDFGEGEIMHLACLDNQLIAVINYYANSSLALGRAKIEIKRASGQSNVVLNEIDIDTAVVAATELPAANFIADNKLYFPMTAPLDGDYRRGIWVVDSVGNLTLELMEEEVESATTKTYQGIYRAGNQWWIAHSNDGSVNCSASDATYSTTLSSILETLIFNAGDSDLVKSLVGVTVMTEPLPEAGEVKLYCLTDEDLLGTIIAPLDWGTALFDNTTNYSISQSAVNSLPKEWKEIQFRAESYGGAKITGIKYKVELIGKELY